MADQKLNLTQTQNLVMTPQLQQAIKLLQLSNLELSAYLESEVEQNPLLEKGSDENTEAHDPLAEDDTAATPEDSYEFLESDNADSLNGAQPLDVEANDYYSGDEVVDWKANKSSSHFDEGGGGTSFDENLTSDATLQEHLSNQINLELKDDLERLIATFLVGSLDEAGYLHVPLTEIAEQLNCPLELVDDTLARVQQFDPAGCFARDLRECLRLQLIDLNRFDPAIEALLENLEMLADGRVDELCRLCNTNMEDLADMIADIKALNPKPGDDFRTEQAESMIPDVFVRFKKDGTWQVELNTQTLPRVLVNNRYYTEISGKTRNKEEKKYLSNCHQSASWLAKALDQRAQTILKVATALVSKQDAFFRYGIEHLRPLTLKDIAEAIDMHESTVSRVTTNKYMATPRGVFELKYFFTSGISSSGGGEDHSAEFVRHKIKEIVDQEPQEKPFSDDKLVKLLGTQGIDVARRTVAKYREQLDIGSSTDRKKAYKRDNALKKIS